ncbi:MAG: hypothetical protein K0S07_592 [Chlamydiales bacterium]|jgi:hypothetical protein|nr:hypothetical protein [Chlamydiales bacterium]
MSFTKRENAALVLEDNPIDPVDKITDHSQDLR